MSWKQESVCYWAQKHEITDKHIDIGHKIFSRGDSDSYTVKVIHKLHEETMYLEQGFEWLGVKDSLIFLRKIKC